MGRDFLINGNIKARVYSSTVEIKHVLVSVHGFTGSKNSSTQKILGDALNAEGLEVVTFDLPRHGDNKCEEPIRYKECIECLREVDKYVKETYKGYKISYLANSYGGYLLMNFLNDTDYDYHRIILKAPAINIDKVFKDVVAHKEFESLKTQVLNIDGIHIDWEFYNELVANRLINKYENNTRFLYVMQGRKDEVVNYLDNEMFFETRCSGNYKIHYFENSKHSFKSVEENQELVKLVRNILEF